MGEALIALTEPPYPIEPGVRAGGLVIMLINDSGRASDTHKIF